MSQSLIDFLYKNRREQSRLSLSVTAARHWLEDIISLLYPQRGRHFFESRSELESSLQLLKDQLTGFMTNLREITGDSQNQCLKKSEEFFAQLPTLAKKLDTDAQAALEGDPAAKSLEEVILSYPGFWAVCVYRLAHQLHHSQVELLPRILSEYAHEKTGIDIHPSAAIGEGFFIDHGTGVVIGETCVIGKNVKIYQGVTLGALSVKKDMQSLKRHPTIEDDVVIYANATILGGKTVVGAQSVIGGNVWLTHSVPAQSKIFHESSHK